MVGIVSYGGYIPRLRLNRMSIFQNMGWFAPAIIMVAQGERSFCNWDEDSVTMAVEASRDCLKGMDKKKVDALYLGSTTLPFADRSCAGIAKTALNLRNDTLVQDFTTSLRCGTSALITALETIKGGDRRQVLVTASDRREAKAGYFYEMWFGDGAASFLVGNTDVIAEFGGSHSVSHDFVDHYRGAERKYHHTAPVNMIYGLREALRIIAEEGLEARFSRHKLNHKALVAGIEGMGLSMQVPEAERLTTLNAIRIPEGVDDVKVRKALLNDFGIEIGGGLGNLAGRIWRVGLMGHSSRKKNVLLFLTALETILKSQGVKVKPGGVEAAAAVYPKA